MLYLFGFFVVSTGNYWKNEYCKYGKNFYTKVAQLLEEQLQS